MILYQYFNNFKFVPNHWETPDLEAIKAACDVPTHMMNNSFHRKKDLQPLPLRVSLISLGISKWKPRRPLVRTRPLADVSFARGEKQAPDSQRGHGSRSKHTQPQSLLAIG